MTRYWVIAPFDSTKPKVWDRVWQFDLTNEVISIGWKELGDFSSLSESELKAAVQQTYGHTSVLNMLWDFYHSTHVGDIVIARRGRKTIAGVGTVTRPAYYSHAKNIEASGPEHAFSNHLSVRWHDTPRDKEFDRIVFGMRTVTEISETKYRELVGEPLEDMTLAVDPDVEDETEFVLEKYLEDFIVSNFAAIFRGELVLYQDPEENVLGQQYTTDVGIIDILAREPTTNSLVVIELKKGRESDKVIGQTLRYMGWVSENLCQNGQAVKGIIICKDSDSRLSYALRMVENITIKYYSVDFKLSNMAFDV